jgi:hypothetical protein
MTRWTLLAIACAVAGCDGRDRDEVSREGSEAAATADTALRADRDTSAVPASEEVDRAEPKSAPRARAPERPADREAEGAAGGPTGAEAMGGVRGEERSKP